MLRAVLLSRRGTNAPHFKYRGGKAILRRTIVRWAKLNGITYIEPFAGRGNVFFLMERIARFKRWIINDPTTLDFFNAIMRYDGRELPYLDKKQGLELMDANPEQFNLMEPVLTRCGGQARLGDSITGVRGENLGEFRLRLLSAKQSLQRTLVQGSDGVDLLEKWHNDSTAFIYLDPPYLRSKVGVYSDRSVDWYRMFRLLKSARAKWLFSHYPVPEVVEALGPPIAIIKNVPVTPTPGVLRRVEEGLWANYQQPPNRIDFGDISRPVLRWSLNLLRIRRRISLVEWPSLVPSHWKPATIRTQFRGLGLFPDHYFDGATMFHLDYWSDTCSS